MRLAAHSTRIVYQLQPHKRPVLDKMFFVGVKESLTKNHYRRTVYLTSVESSFRMMWSSQIPFRDQSTGKCWKNEKGEKLSILYNSTRTLFCNGKGTKQWLHMKQQYPRDIAPLRWCYTVRFATTEFGRFDTKSFRCKSFRYELKKWYCTKISITLSIKFAGEHEKHFGWIFFVL